MTTSLLPTIQAKSDQMNAEDLIGGPITIRVTDVRVSESDEQPVWIGYEGDNGKPFKPCKTVRRLLVRIWGDDSTVYRGRALTLYLDPEVKYGGMKVGGIRVSQASHIDGPKSFFLTETRGKKREITVRPLQINEGPSLSDAIEALNAAPDLMALQRAWKAFPEFQKAEAFEARKNERKDELSSQSGEGF